MAGIGPRTRACGDSLFMKKRLWRWGQRQSVGSKKQQSSKQVREDR